MTTRLVVLASGNGSNLQAIIDACEAETLHAHVVGMVSDNHHAFALQRAAQHNIACRVVDATHTSRSEFNNQLAHSFSYNDISSLEKIFSNLFLLNLIPFSNASIMKTPPLY